MNDSLDDALDVYVPGAWHCLQCGFALQKATIFVQSGTIGSSRDDVLKMTGELCPNDGTTMARETWHDRAVANLKWGSDLMNEIINIAGAQSLPEALERLRAAVPPPASEPGKLIEQLEYCLFLASAESSNVVVPRKIIVSTLIALRAARSGPTDGAPQPLLDPRSAAAPAAPLSATCRRIVQRGSTIPTRMNRSATSAAQHSSK